MPCTRVRNDEINMSAAAKDEASSSAAAAVVAKVQQEQQQEQQQASGAAAAAASSSAAPAQPLEQRIYSCQRCRLRLFSSFHLVPHDASQDAAGNKLFHKNKYQESGAGKPCTSVFLDETLLPWVKTGVNGDSEGNESSDDKDLLCPNAKCKFKIGSKLWQGTQCSCGAWVTPAFKVLLSRVDVF